MNSLPRLARVAMAANVGHKQKPRRKTTLNCVSTFASSAVGEASRAAPDTNERLNWLPESEKHTRACRPDTSRGRRMNTCVDSGCEDANEKQYAGGCHG